MSHNHSTSGPQRIHRGWQIALSIGIAALLIGGTGLVAQEPAKTANDKLTIDDKIQKLSETPWAELMNRAQEAAQAGEQEKWRDAAQTALKDAQKLPQELRSVAAAISKSVLGEFYMATGEAQKAEEHFLSAQQLAAESGALPADAILLQIGLRLNQLYLETGRADDSIKLLENGWKALQNVERPLPQHVIAYGGVLIHSWVERKEYGKAKRAADRLDSRLESMENLDPNLESGAKSAIVMAWSKAGKGQQALEHMRRINQLLETTDLMPWAVEATLQAGVAYGRSVKDTEITSHFESALQRLHQTPGSPGDRGNPPQDSYAAETDVRQQQSDNGREMLMLQLEQVDSDLQFAEMQLAQVSAQVEADYAAYRASRDYASRHSGRVGALTGIPGTLVARQQDMQLQFEQQQLQNQVQSLRMRRAQIEQALRGR